MIMPSEKEYIQICKREIEKLFALDNASSSLKTRDFEYLSGKIKEKSGVALSVSTLKRLWKDDFLQIPQPATLNALASVLNYSNWQEFKQKNQIITTRNVKPVNKKALLFSFFILMVIVVILILVKNRSNEPVINGEIHFSADKTISLGVPNTVVFNYDVSNVVADSFFIQQSWNERFRERIDPKKQVISSIYHLPGFHRAKLIANNTVVATQNVHILSDGWLPYINYKVTDLIPICFNPDSTLSDGHFQIDKSDLQLAGIDIKKDFKLRLNNSRDFGVTDNDFSVKTIFKSDSMKAATCPRIQIMLVFEANIFWISLIKKGCEYYADYKIGEIYANGKDNDLSSLGCNIFEWQDLEFSVHQKLAEVRLNGKPIIHQKYVQDFGEMVGIIYTFDGLGSVDFISVSGADGKIVYQDDFD
jgi:hypothetical protein